MSQLHLIALCALLAAVSGVHVFEHITVEYDLLSPESTHPRTNHHFCILVPVTSRRQAWTRLEDSFVYQMPLASLGSVLEVGGEFLYTVFIGYDKGDVFFDNSTTLDALTQWTKTHLPHVSLETRAFANPLQKPGPTTNFLSREAYNHGCDFMYRINDDTELLTPFASAFVSTLYNFTPPLLGVVGPTCNQGNTAILTHDCVHRSHLDLFPTHYPEELTDWWRDDWVSYVYGEGNTKKLGEVVVVHHMLGTRYEVNWESAKRLRALVEQGRALVEQDKTFGPAYL